MDTVPLNRPWCIQTLGIGLAALAGGGLLMADVHLYKVISERSPVVLHGRSGTLDWQEQAPGSLTSALQGWLLFDFDGHTGQFLPGSQISCLSSNRWEAGPHGITDTAAANFGGKFTDGTGIFAGHEVLAVRNLRLNLESGQLPFTIEGKLDTSAIHFTIPAGFDARLDYFYEGLVLSLGNRPLNGLTVVNLSTLPGINEIEFWAIPFDISFTVTGALGGDVELELIGTLSFELPQLASQPNAVLVHYPETPARATLLWEPKYRLQHAARLSAPVWTDVAAQPPYDIELTDSVGFFRVVL